MLKKIAIWLAVALLFMTGCSPNINDDEVVKKEDETVDQEPSIVPSYQLSDETYKMILPFKPSAARGVIASQLGNRLDIDEMEEGLRRHSKKFYDPNSYYFQAGQQLSSDTVLHWLGRDLTEKQLDQEVEEEIDDTKAKEDEAEIAEIRNEIKAYASLALNPELPGAAGKDGAPKSSYRENPRYLSHILEQNFLKKNKDNSVELVGMSIGLAMKSVYQFQPIKYGPYFYEDISKATMLKQGKQMAQTILERIRKMDGLQDIPIMFALYREEEQGSLVPGNFVAKVGVKGSDMSIGKWDALKEDYVLFPSDEAEEKYYDDSQMVSNFANEISQFFPNYIGVIGKGFYINEELKKLTLTIPIEFYGKGEVIGFTQYAYGLIKELLPDYFDVEIKVTSSEKLESYIYRNAGDENPTVHILD
ncbi:CamS family sex pheromone protein [Virgibacillus flavescens]|uniref:CamS family sex pheromone protein n=1 Tax=Virgibacillus flavescens TaxID=1611422 RepID=UPI003D34CAE7